jgi:hypothetical protein
LPSGTRRGAAHDNRPGRDPQGHGRVFGLTLGNFVDEEDNLAAIVRRLRGGGTPAAQRQTRPDCRVVRGGKARKLCFPCDQMRAEGEHDKRRGVVPNIDHPPLGAEGPRDVAFEVRELHVGELEVRDLGRGAAGTLRPAGSWRRRRGRRPRRGETRATSISISRPSRATRKATGPPRPTAEGAGDVAQAGRARWTPRKADSHSRTSSPTGVPPSASSTSPRCKRRGCGLGAAQRAHHSGAGPSMKRKTAGSWNSPTGGRSRSPLQRLACVSCTRAISSNSRRW